MISSSALIAVLMKVVIIVMANPAIPQDVKDQVFSEINSAVRQERSAEETARIAPAQTPSQASPASAPVVQSRDMAPTFSITKTGPLTVRIEASGTGWTKAYYSIVKMANGEENVSDKGFVYPDEPILNHSFDESMAGAFETSWTLYSGTGKDNRRDTGRILSSGSGSIIIGE